MKCNEIYYYYYYCFILFSKFQEPEHRHVFIKLFIYNYIFNLKSFNDLIKIFDETYEKIINGKLRFKNITFANGSSKFKIKFKN